MIELDKIILFEINQIDNQLDRFKALFEETQHKEPNHIEISAIAGTLHSFYNGIEKIFDMVAQNLDKFIPDGGKTHQELLNNACAENDERPAIIDKDTYLLLREYLKFRHFYRHTYTYHLQWERMKDLACNLFTTWESVKSQLSGFAVFLANNK